MIHSRSNFNLTLILLLVILKFIATNSLLDNLAMNKVNEERASEFLENLSKYPSGIYMETSQKFRSAKRNQWSILKTVK